MVTTFNTTILIVPEIEKALVSVYTPKKATMPDNTESRIIEKSHVNSVKVTEKRIKIVTLIMVL